MKPLLGDEGVLEGRVISFSKYNGDVSRSCPEIKERLEKSGISVNRYGFYFAYLATPSLSELGERVMFSENAKSLDVVWPVNQPHKRVISMEIFYAGVYYKGLEDMASQNIDVLNAGAGRNVIECKTLAIRELRKYFNEYEKQSQTISIPRVLALDPKNVWKFLDKRYAQRMENAAARGKENTLRILKRDLLHTLSLTHDGRIILPAVEQFTNFFTTEEEPNPEIVKAGIDKILAIEKEQFESAKVLSDIIEKGCMPQVS